jgi:hypothetical protein
MFQGEKDAVSKAKKIVSALSSHKGTLSHNRQIPVADCESFGLRILKLEDDSTLQDLVLTVHHAFMHTFASTSATKIIENHDGQAMVILQSSPR